MTQDRPDAAELLDALAEFLFTDVREWAPREERFQVLVAANLCAILGRELRAGSEPLREDLALLLELSRHEPPAGEPSDAELREAVRAAEAELARRLRAGELDGEPRPSRGAPAPSTSAASSTIARPGLRGLSAPDLPALALPARQREGVQRRAPPSIAIASPVM